MNEVNFSRSCGVLEALYDTSIDCYSPVFGDFERVVSYDEQKQEVVTFVPVDYSKLNAQLGEVDFWKLDNLLKAGINPAFPVHTSQSVSRLEGVDVIQSAAESVENLINDVKNSD